MAERGPDRVEVVVLPADPHALLGCRRACVVAAFLTEKQVLELVHTSVGEQQRRVVPRYEGRRWHDAVAVTREVVKEALPDLCGGHAIGHCTGVRSRSVRSRPEPSQSGTDRGRAEPAPQELLEEPL